MEPWSQPSSTHPTERIQGYSPTIAALRAQIRHLASFDTVGQPFVPTMLLYGETGTGKGLVARVIHESGPRAQSPFIDVNCASLPETLLEAELFGFEAGAFTDAKRAKPGLFEASAGGTLFLDEVDAFPLLLQSKLLQALGEKRIRRLGAVVDHPVDFKLIAATQRDLNVGAMEGWFRPDLYHRLAVVVLQLPPLRRRGDDILMLARQLLHRYAEAYQLPPKQLSQTAERWLLSYRWPGNVRELSHLMERVTLLSQEVTLDPATLQQLCLSLSPTSGAAGKASVRRAHDPFDETARIQEALMRAGGKVAQAPRDLGVSRGALRHRIHRYGIGLPNKPNLPSPATAPQPGSLHRPARNPGAPAHASLQTPCWEQKPVAVLAIDLVLPMVSWLETVSDEAWTRLAQWERNIVEKACGFGGTLLHPSRSPFLVAFGIPRALEQMPQRAVEAAVSIQQLVAAAVAPQGGEPHPEVRLALHLGTVLVDTRSSDLTPQPLPIGDTLSLPVRLLGHAAPGQILGSPQIGKLIEGCFELRARELPMGEAQAEQVVTYRAIDIGVRRPPPTAVEVRARGQFVGRQRELTTLHTILAEVEAGRGQVVGIVGDPGIGKSRLLYEFHHSLTGARVTYGEGRCVSYGSTIPYLPILDLLRSHAGITPTDDPEIIAAQVRSRLQEAGIDPEEGSPYLLRLLGMRAGTESLAILSPQAVKTRTFETLRRFSLNSSRQRPLILAIEDLHWTDQTSEDYLASLVESLPGAPILLLVTYRPGYRPPWIERSSTTQIALPPLSPQESLTVIHAIPQREQVPAPLAQAILARAEGNPFFLEELTRAAAEHGEILAHDPVPTTIQGVLMARIDRLPDETRQVLQTASVLGREFRRQLLDAIWAGGTPLDPHLRELRRLEFLYEQICGGEPVDTFRHALTQEVVHQSLPPQRRQALHAAAGQALESLYADHLEDAYDRLAYHFSKAEQADKAVAYLTRFAEKAARGYAHAEAASALQGALAHVEQLPDGERDRRRLELVLQLAHSLHLLGRFQERLQLLLGEQDRCEQLQDPALAGPYYFCLGYTYGFVGEHELGVLNAQRAIAEATRCGDEATMGKAYEFLSVEDLWSGHWLQGIEHSQRAVSLLEGSQERLWLGMAYLRLAMNHFFLGAFPPALEAVARTYEIGETRGDPRLQTDALCLIGWVAATRGEWEAGITACQQGLERSPDPLNTAFALGLLGYAYLEKGDPLQAMPVLERSVDLMGQFGYAQLQGWFTVWLGEAYLLDGKLDEAQALAKRGLDLSCDSKFLVATGWAQRVFGRIAGAKNAFQAAERYFTAALGTFTSLQARFEVGRTHLALAELAQAQQRPDDLARHASAAHRLFTALEVPCYAQRSACLAKVAAVPLDPLPATVPASPARSSPR